MNNKMTKIYLMMWVIALFISCAKVQSPQDAKSTPSPRIATKQTTILSTSNNFDTTQAPPTGTLNPAMVALITTPRPTLESESLAKLTKLLHLETCTLPCYLGITPGYTTWDETKSILSELGAYIVEGKKEDNRTHYYTYLDIGDESAAIMTPNPNIGITNLRIIQELNLIVEDEKVQKLWTNISTRKFISRFQEYWSRYTLRQIFLQFGVPDQILTGKRDAGGIGYGLFAIYEKNGLVFSVSGSAQDGYICPESEKLSISLEFSVTNPDSGLDLYTPPFTVLPTGRVYVPIDEVLGVDKEEFYAQLISDSQACFKAMPK